MATIKQIQFKRSNTTGHRPKPADIAEGELAINIKDATMFTKNADGVIIDLGFAKGGKIDGDVIQIGNYTQTGNYNITGDITVSSGIMIGDSDSGLKGREDGWIDTYSNGVVTSSVIDRQSFFNRPVTFRYRSDNAGDIDAMLMSGSLIKIDTTTDGNKIGDGYSYFGLADTGKYNHYLRGAGATYIDSLEGLRISGVTTAYKEIHANGGVIFNSKPNVGLYDYISIPDKDSGDPANQFNNLRKFKSAIQGSANTQTIHEIALGAHPEPKYAHSLSYFQGEQPTNWMLSIGTNGVLKTNSFESYAAGAAYTLTSTTAGSSYIRGINDGKNNAWLLGKTNATKNLIFQNNMTDGLSSSLMLQPDAARLNVAFNDQLTVLDGWMQIDGNRWASKNSHSWADQWNQNPPVLLHFGTVPGASDYYPGYAMQNTATNFGFQTRFEMGIIRTGARYGDGVLRVSEYGFATNAGKNAANYMFGIDGLAKFPHIKLDKTISIGDQNTLGDSSISLGYGNTGLIHSGGGTISVLSNGINICNIGSRYFDHPGLWATDGALWTEWGRAIISFGHLVQADDTYSTFVRDVYVRSDIKVKKELREFENPTRLLKKMPGYLYLQKRGKDASGADVWEPSAGLIAQDVQAELPELVHGDESSEALLRLNYNGIIALNTSAINAHTDKIDELEAKIQKLEEIISTLI